jgi:hypothetical protein
MNGSLLFPSSSSLLPLAIPTSPNDSTDTGMEINAIAYTIQLVGLKISAYSIDPIETIKSTQLIILSLSFIFHLKMVC